MGDSTIGAGLVEVGGPETPAGANVGCVAVTAGDGEGVGSTTGSPGHPHVTVKSLSAFVKTPSSFVSPDAHMLATNNER